MAKRKIYEFVGMNNVHTFTKYCNITVNLDFKDGNTIEGKNARLATTNAFAQDAIENDNRFGKSIRLLKTYDVPDPVGLAATQTKAAETTTETTATAKKSRAKKAKSETEEGTTEVTSVKTINDAIEYFTSLGEAVESDEQIAALKEKYGVTFPNLI